MQVTPCSVRHPTYEYGCMFAPLMRSPTHTLCNLLRSYVQQPWKAVVRSRRHSQVLSLPRFPIWPDISTERWAGFALVCIATWCWCFQSGQREGCASLDFREASSRLLDSRQSQPLPLSHLLNTRGQRLEELNSGMPADDSYVSIVSQPLELRFVTVHRKGACVTEGATQNHFLECRSGRKELPQPSGLLLANIFDRGGICFLKLNQPSKLAMPRFRCRQLVKYTKKHTH